MANAPQLKVETREITGRKVKQLRREGIVPGNIFGKKINSTAVKIEQTKLDQIIDKAGETTLIELTVGLEKKARPVLITNVHRHPVTDTILHVDFHQVDLKQKVTASIPVELTGESIAVKEKDGVVNQALLELEVEALPADLPDNIQVDISPLEDIGASILVKDLKIPSKVDVLQEAEAVVVSIVEQAEEEVEAVTPPEAEVEGAEVPEGEAAPEPEADEAPPQKEAAPDKAPKE